MRDKKDSLCWFCKHADGCDGKCCWATKGQPLPNWKAEEGGLYNIVTGRNENGPISEKQRGYFVHECPLFDRKHEFLDFGGVIKKVTKAFNCHRSSLYYNLLGWLKLYEQQTSNPFPTWVRCEALKAHKNIKKRVSFPEGLPDYEDPYGMSEEEINIVWNQIAPFNLEKRMKRLKKKSEGIAKKESREVSLESFEVFQR